MEFDPSRFEVTRTAPAWMTAQEKVVLYALVVGLQPDRILEVGTLHGGSALIMCAALDDLGAGSLVCLDPNPQLAPETQQAIAHRATMITEGSPRGMRSAVEAAGGPFDLVFIDGDHTMAGVLADLEAALRVLASGGVIVLHDAHYYEVGQAVDRFLSRHRQLRDAGLISCGVTATDEVANGHPISWGGLRMLASDERRPPFRRLRGARAEPRNKNSVR